MVMEGDLTWGGEHNTVSEDVLWSCILETYTILLTNVIPMNSIKIFFKRNY